METEAIVATVIQAQLSLVQQDPSLMLECTNGIDDATVAQFQQYIAANPIQLLPAWPSQPPASPTVIVYPGESEESEQLVGSMVGQDEFAFGEEDTYLGTWFNSTHHVAVYSINQMACIIISKLVLWALIAARPILLDQGLYNARTIEGPLEIASEWGEQSGVDVVFRRTSHIIHDWLMTHTQKFQGQLLRAIQVALQDENPEARING